LESGVRVTAVEKDARFLPLLKAVAEQNEGRLIAIHADALKIDEAGLVGTGASIVANLPYNVASPLLVRWLTGPLRPRAMTLMFQAEVARRITAAPGADDYGRLAIVCQALAEPTILMTLPARAFTPPPKVDSAVVRLVPRPDRPAADLVADLQRLTAAAFGQRRKMLRSSLKALGGPALCEVAGIDPNARAETVPVAGFLAMAAEIKRFSPRAP
jgi:16S rRNA (adenine1518-N6/adenine1519-N6)-dimethyltransferase